MRIIYQKKFLYLVILILVLIIVFGVFYILESKKRYDSFLAYYDQGNEVFVSDDSFLTQVNKIKGYNQGQEYYCWYLGNSSDTLNAIYFFKDSSGQIITKQRPIITVLPSHENYSHFFKIYYVHAGPGYQPNGIKSYQSLKRALDDQIFKLKPTGLVANMPIVSKDIQTDYDKEIEAYYDGEIVKMLEFSKDVKVINEKVEPSPVIVIKTPDKEAYFESFINQDLNNDGDVLDSFNLYDYKQGDPLYSSYYQINYIYVKQNYPSLDQDPAWQSFEDLGQNKGDYVDFEQGIRGLEETNFYYNCPQAK